MSCLLKGGQYPTHGKFQPGGKLLL